MSVNPTVRPPIPTGPTRTRRRVWLAATGATCVIVAATVVVLLLVRPNGPEQGHTRFAATFADGGIEAALLPGNDAFDLDYLEQLDTDAGTAETSLGLVDHVTELGTSWSSAAAFGDAEASAVGIDDMVQLVRAHRDALVPSVDTVSADSLTERFGLASTTSELVTEDMGVVLADVSSGGDVAKHLFWVADFGDEWKVFYID